MRLVHFFRNRFATPVRRFAALNRSQRIHACETLPSRALLSADSLGVSDYELGDETHEYPDEEVSEASPTEIDQIFTSQPVTNLSANVTTVPEPVQPAALFEQSQETVPVTLVADANAEAVPVTSVAERPSSFIERSGIELSAIELSFVDVETDGDTDSILEEISPDLSPLTDQINDTQEQPATRQQTVSPIAEEDRDDVDNAVAVSYTHLTLPTTPYV